MGDYLVSNGGRYPVSQRSTVWEDFMNDLYRNMKRVDAEKAVYDVIL